MARKIFPGSVPLYKGNKLVGAVGISGDGVDQDDIISAMGSTGFEAPMEIRSDRCVRARHPVALREVPAPSGSLKSQARQLDQPLVAARCTPGLAVAPACTMWPMPAANTAAVKSNEFKLSPLPAVKFAIEPPAKR
jgi:hypothetical protein